MTTSKQVRASEAALVARGGRRLSGHLQPDAARALADLVAAGYARSPVAVISAALLDAIKKISRGKS